MLIILSGELESRTFGRLYYRPLSAPNKNRKQNKQKPFPQSAKLTFPPLHVSLLTPSPLSYLPGNEKLVQLLPALVF